MSGKAERTYSVTRTKATWKPRVIDVDPPVFRCPACGAVLEYLSPALLPARLNYLCARADLYLCPQCGRYEFYRDPRWIERDKEKKK